MDVDTDPSFSGTAAASSTVVSSSSSQPPPPPVEEKTIKIHPLAIIGISDHHTRVITGGSALPPDAPVVGLLFGYQDGSAIVIVDAEEMEYPKETLPTTKSHPDVGGPDGEHDHQAAIRKKIELHQKVFPRHVVVGWYRVQQSVGTSSQMDISDNVPSESDLRMNQIEMTQYCTCVESPLFVLMNAASRQSQSESKKAPSSTSSSEIDEQLPLTVYETLIIEGGGSGGSAVFVNVDFELETYGPERIAVEKVFKTQPSQSLAQSKSTDNVAKEGTEPRYAGKKSKKNEQASKTSASSERNQLPSELDMQLDSLQSSIRSMNARMNLLLEFLRKVEKGELPPDDVLLRNIDGLLQQWPLVIGALEETSAPFSSPSRVGRRPIHELENEFNDTMLLSYLAAVAKTAKTVHVYSEKFRVAFETNNQRDIRRSAF